MIISFEEMKIYAILSVIEAILRLFVVLILIWFPILDIIFWVKGAKKSYKGYKENSGRNQAVAGLVFTAIAAHLYLLFLSYLFLALYGLIWGASFAHRLGAF